MVIHPGDFFQILGIWKQVFLLLWNGRYHPVTHVFQVVGQFGIFEVFQVRNPASIALSLVIVREYFGKFTVGCDVGLLFGFQKGQCINDFGEKTRF